MKILIVDDSKAMRMIVRRALREAGYGSAKVREATNGLEGLASVAEELPDVILSDWNMPEMKGIEFLKELRAKGHETPFGFVTSENSEEMRNNAFEAGADFFVTKPFTPDSFQTALRTVTEAA